MPKQLNMKDPVYKLIELTGTSTASTWASVKAGCQKACDTTKNGFNQASPVGE
jgi:flavin-binding protein dodecin